MLGSEVTDLSQCLPEPVQQEQQQGAAFAIAVAPLFPNDTFQLMPVYPDSFGLRGLQIAGLWDVSRTNIPGSFMTRSSKQKMSIEKRP